VTFDCGDDGVSFTWSGVAEDPALVEALARSMTDHLPRVIELASEAEEQEEVSEDAQDRIATADVDGVSAENFQCLVDALDVYELAIMDCRAFNQMATDLQDAVPCGIAASCPYDLSAPLDADTGDPTLDEVLEMVPVVDAEVDRIEGELRAACGSIVVGLGGDDAGLDATGACELAVSLVDDVVRANPGVYFGYSMKPESRLYWSGSPSTAARLDALVAVLSEHLDEVLRAGGDARAEEAYANDVSSRDSAVDDPALLECEGEARAVYAGAAQECSDLAFAADAFLPTLGIG